jgi:hypothetical protein
MDNINREHPEYVLKRAMWRKYRTLYSGGELMSERAFEYLVRRNKEPNDVYQERLCRVFYENYIGSIIDWYAATLLRREPTLTFQGTNEAGIQFYNGFAEDCDLKGTTLAEFFRQQLVNTLVFGRTYIALDFPRCSQPATNRAEEDASGMSRAFLVEYTPDEVINWSHDEDGNLAWIVIRTSCLRQEKVTDSGWRKETRWVHYDRETFRIYSRIEGGDAQGAIQLIDEGRHALAAQGRVPVFEVKVTEGLWLMNKAALLQLEHFNKSNALAWALTMGLFAMPVVYSDREWNQIVGDSYYIQLGPQDKFGWTEPTGHVFQIAADNLERLKDEIYRVCYLMTQASGNQSANVSQSGVSKQRDFAITQEVLRAYGDAVKETIKQLMRAIESARQDGLAIDVTGLDEFDIEDFGGELDDAKKLLDLGIGSETLKKQLFKKLALKYFSDARQDIKTQIAAEIDSSFERGTE